MTHYETPGVDPSASADEIKQAFRRAAAQAHPDRDGGDPERMAAINRAYECLGDPARREVYDRTGCDAPAARLDDEARSHLVSVFSAMLDAGVDHDIVGKARQVLQTRRADLTTQLVLARRHALTLLKRKDLVRTKGGGADNLFHHLVDKRIADTDRAVSAMEHEATVCAAAAAMLEKYESAGDTEATQVTRVLISRFGNYSPT